MPITHVQVRAGDSVGELGSKVMGNTAAAMLQERDRIDWSSVETAVQWLIHASRVDIYAIGHAAAVATDAQYKFMRVGLPCAAYTDERLQRLAAEATQPGDVLLLISAGGKLPHLVEVCRVARARDARVVAVTTRGSPLAQAADLAVALDHRENLDTHVAMVSRLLQLVVIDVLAVGVAAMRPSISPIGVADDTDEPLAPAGGSKLLLGRGQAPNTSGRPPLGVSTAAGLAAMTSHGL
jgi:glucokinase